MLRPAPAKAAYQRADKKTKGRRDGATTCQFPRVPAKLHRRRRHVFSFLALKFRNCPMITIAFAVRLEIFTRSGRPVSALKYQSKAAHFYAKYLANPKKHTYREEMRRCECSGKFARRNET
jgi:hypothetical protein